MRRDTLKLVVWRRLSQHGKASDPPAALGQGTNGAALPMAAAGPEILRRFFVERGGGVSLRKSCSSVGGMSRKPAGHANGRGVSLALQKSGRMPGPVWNGQQTTDNRREGGDVVSVKPCLDCGRATRNGSRCPACAAVHDAAKQAKRDELRGTRTERGYDNDWLRLSRAAIKQQPWCSECGSGEDLTADHVIPLGQGGLSEKSNVRVLCRRCNGRKAAR